MNFWKYFFGKKTKWWNFSVIGFTVLVLVFEIKDIYEEGPTVWAAIILIFITAFFTANIFLNYSGFKNIKK